MPITPDTMAIRDAIKAAIVCTSLILIHAKIVDTKHMVVLTKPLL